ncbi:serine hydrolase domain-containing protein [Streptomyces sp. V4-01]|uniref:Serine hydrolase domain-containing protein n=1 Tax=Actinacidiphila polyblastidii TaxID=3110430 RepID=A0ABU7PFR6_9ACTN|nr:serine hydrolase domain-containing protein [Streptomyces sp. V4-01]
MTSHAGRPLPRSTPSAEGVDADGVLALLDALEAAPGVEPHSLMILRHGRLIAEGWWAPYAPARPQLVYSLSKSFTTTAAGLAVGDGLVDLDAPVLRYFPELDGEVTDPRSRALLVRHVAAMASGHVADTFERALAVDRENLVRGFLLLPPDREPGTVFAYNQPATYTLAAIVQRVTGQRLTDWLRSRLYGPLGIAEAHWEQFPPGRDLAFSGLYTTTDAVARLGQLYLRDGVWEGRRLLPASWVAEATRPQVSNADDASRDAAPDWQQGYGFQFWMSRHGYRGDGAYGQYMLVLPEQDAVVALASETKGMQEVLDLVWRHLLPAFGAAAPEGVAAAADERLRLRLAALQVPPLSASPAPPGDAAAWSAAEFTRAGGDADPDRPKLTGAAVTADAAGGGWTLTLTEAGRQLDLRFGGAGWSVDEGGGERPATAVSAGWTDQDTLVADIAFLETPHHLVVTCSRATGTLTARWSNPPLRRGRLLTHHAPRP